MKAKHFDGYTEEHVTYCERALVTLLHRLGPEKENIYLIGGMVPRYLFPEARHAGTADVDIVLSLDTLTAGNGYPALEQTLREMGFRCVEADGKPVYWRWRNAVTARITVVFDLLCDTEDASSGFYVSFAGERRLAAFNVWGANLAARDFVAVQLRATLLDAEEEVVETIRVAGVATFLVLKARAYDARAEEKDAYDLVYCLLHEGPARAAAHYHALKARAGDPTLLDDAERVLRKDFASDGHTEGYRKKGAMAYARFQNDPGNPDANVRRQREASGVVEAFLKELAIAAESAQAETETADA